MKMQELGIYGHDGRWAASGLMRHRRLCFSPHIYTATMRLLRGNVSSLSRERFMPSKAESWHLAGAGRCRLPLKRQEGVIVCYAAHMSHTSNHARFASP